MEITYENQKGFTCPSRSATLELICVFTPSWKSDSRKFRAADDVSFDWIVKICEFKLTICSFIFDNSWVSSVIRLLAVSTVWGVSAG